MKKIISLVLALAMVLMVGASFAAPTVISPGSITVESAQKGATYTAIKVLDAVVSDKGITYSEPIPSELVGIVGVTTVTVGTAPNTKTYQTVGKINNPDVATSDYVAALRLYANNHIGDASGVYTQTATSNTVTFSNLPTGFYVIVSSVHDSKTDTTNNNVMACSTFDPDADPHTANGKVVEKNTTEIEVYKTADSSYTIGDTVEYTATFVLNNYMKNETTGKLEVVTQYEIQDTLPDFLKGASVTKIEIGNTVYTKNNSDATKAVSDDNFPNVSKFAPNVSFYIPWADESSTGSHIWTSRYNNGTTVKITYEAELTDTVKIDGKEKEGNINKIKVRPWVDRGNTPEPWEKWWEKTHELFTYGAALIKVDGADTTKTLAGAKFHFKGLIVKETVANQVGNYTVVSYDPTSTDYGTEVEVDSNGNLYIVGLKSGLTLTGEETVAPPTYNLLQGTFPLTPTVMSKTIWAEGGHKWFDADGNLIKETSSITAPATDVMKNVDELTPYAFKVLNNAGTELPHTGGIGTTIFYILGGLLVIGAAVILVARRKAQD